MRLSVKAPGVIQVSPHYFLPGTTLYVTLTVEELPTASMAVTANVLVPLDDVLTRLPFATGPVHDVIPAPPSLQA